MNSINSDNCREDDESDRGERAFTEYGGFLPTGWVTTLPPTSGCDPLTWSESGGQGYDPSMSSAKSKPSRRKYRGADQEIIPRGKPKQPDPNGQPGDGGGKDDDKGGSKGR